MNAAEQSGAAQAPDRIERAVMSRVAWRVLPFLMVCYFVAFVDRVNAGFAALHMNHDVGLSAAAFGLGGGLFYVTYVLFEIPSNLAMARFGARLWIARIMISWGLVSGASAFVVGPWSFYFARMMLGAAEAGFFPGVILYLTYWFPRAYRGRVVAMFMVAIPVSSFLGSPISAALLGADGWLGWHGWQWLFLIEAAPAVLLGLLALAWLPDSPAAAKWLPAAQREWLAARLAAEERDAPPPVQHASWKRVFGDKYVWAASFIYAGASGASQCLSLWQPQIIKSFGQSDLTTGFLNAVPFGVASILMLVWGRSSDARRERVWHTALPLALLAASLVAAVFVTSLAATMILLCVSVTATYTVKGPFWALSTEWLSARSAAAGIAQVNAIGNIGGFIGSWMLGTIKDATGSYPLGLTPLAALSALGCAILLRLSYSGARVPTALASAPTPQL